MLLSAADPAVLREKLQENETIMKEMSLTREEKLKKTGEGGTIDIKWLTNATFKWNLWCRRDEGGPATGPGEDGCPRGVGRHQGGGRPALPRQPEPRPQP
jgi:hypothetical protein